MKFLQRSRMKNTHMHGNYQIWFLQCIAFPTKYNEEYAYVYTFDVAKWGIRDILAIKTSVIDWLNTQILHTWKTAAL